MKLKMRPVDIVCVATLFFICQSFASFAAEPEQEVLANDFDTLHILPSSIDVLERSASAMRIKVRILNDTKEAICLPVHLLPSDGVNVNDVFRVETQNGSSVTERPGYSFHEPLLIASNVILPPGVVVSYTATLARRYVFEAGEHYSVTYDVEALVCRAFEAGYPLSRYPQARKVQLASTDYSFFERNADTATRVDSRLAIFAD
jgi:hypothetical protein